MAIICNFSTKPAFMRPCTNSRKNAVILNFNIFSKLKVPMAIICNCIFFEISTLSKLLVFKLQKGEIANDSNAQKENCF